MCIRDRLKGVVYISLADNMLYKSGSYEISNKAEAVLSKIAKIIQDYKDYDVLDVYKRQMKVSGHIAKQRLRMSLKIGIMIISVVLT